MDRDSILAIYKRPISEVHSHTRLYRECVAMLAQVSARGLSLTDAVCQSVSIMDIGIERCGTIPVRDLLALHTALAEIIRPELPQTAELLQWDAVRDKSGLQRLVSFLAPVSAIRKVMIWTIAFFLIFFTVIIFGPLTPKEVADGIPLFGRPPATQEAQRPAPQAEAEAAAERAGAAAVQADQAATRARLEADRAGRATSPVAEVADGLADAAQAISAENRAALMAAADLMRTAAATLRAAAAALPEIGPAGFWNNYGATISLTLFFASLSAIGACFATLYDANRHLAEGTYDPRYGASYAVRIGLGMISGFLLSQVLVVQNDQLLIFGRMVLALLGGFAGQLVYHILDKLVRAVETLFEEDPRELIARTKAEAEAREAAAIRSQQALQTRLAADLASQLQTTNDPDLKAAFVRTFMDRIAGGAPAGGAGDAAADPVAVATAKAAAIAALMRRVLEVLPEGEGAPIREALGKLDEALARIGTLSDRGELLGEIARLSALGLAEGPLGALLARDLGKLAGPLAALGLTPAGVAGAVIMLTGQAAVDTFRRWKVTVLNAPYVPELLAVDPIDAAAVTDALNAQETKPEAFGVAADDMASLNALGIAAADLDPDDFFERFGRASGGSPDDFATRSGPLRAAMQKLRADAVKAVVATEIPAQALTLSGAASRGQLLGALASVQGTANALAALERLFLLAAATRGTPTGVTELQALLDLIATLPPKGSPA